MSKEEKLRGMIRKLYQGDINESAFNDDLDLISMLGFDSIKIIMLVVEIEECFQICIGQEELEPYFLCKYKNLKKLLGEKVNEC